MNTSLRVLKNSTVLSLSILLERVVAFSLPWYVARIRGKETWGYYATALTFITMSAPLARWGLDQLLPREIARDRDRVGKLLSSAGVVGGVTSTLTMIIVIVGVHFLDYPPHVRRLIRLGMLFTLLPYTESTLCEAAVNGLEKMEWITVVRFPLTILRVVVSIVMLSVGLNIDILFVIWGMYYLLLLGVYLFLFKHFIPDFYLHIEQTMIWALALQAIPFVAIIFTGETFKQVDRVLLSKLWNTDAVGIYSIGVMPVQIIYLLASAVMNALFPGLSRTYSASQQRFSVLVPLLFKLIVAGIFPLALTVIASAEMVILFLFGQSYSSSIDVLRISAIGIPIAFGARLLYRTILASDNERSAAKIALINSVTGVAFSVFLIPSYGVLGASISNVCVQVIGLIQNLFYISRGIAQFDFKRSLLRLGGCMLVSALMYLEVEPWSKLGAWLVSQAVFISMLLISKTITGEDIKLLSWYGIKFSCLQCLRQ